MQPVPKHTDCIHCNQYDAKSDSSQILVVVCASKPSEYMSVYPALHDFGMCLHAYCTTQPFEETFKWMKQQQCRGFLVIRAPVQFSKQFQGWKNIKALVKDTDELYLFHYTPLLGLPNGSRTRVVPYDSRAFYVSKTYLDTMSDVDSTHELVRAYTIEKRYPVASTFPQLVYSDYSDPVWSDPYLQNMMTLVGLVFIPLVLCLLTVFLVSYLVRSNVFRLVFIIITIIYLFTVATSIDWPPATSTHSSSSATSPSSSRNPIASAEIPSSSSPSSTSSYSSVSSEQPPLVAISNSQ